jgi:hypothetical protein
MLDAALGSDGVAVEREDGPGAAAATVGDIHNLDVTNAAELERAAYLLAHLRGRGITVQPADGNRLVVTPGSLLTEGESAEVRESILLLLAREPVPEAEWTAGDREQVRLARAGAFGWYYDGIAGRRWWSRKTEPEDEHAEGKGP